MSDSSREPGDPLSGDVEEYFRAGRPLTEEQQIGRGPIIDGLADRVLRGEVKKLYEGRRVGKTTVARAAVRRIRNIGGVDAEVNLSIYRNPESVANELAAQLAAGLTVPEVVRSGLRRVTGVLSPARPDVGDEAAVILDVVARLTDNTASPARVLLNAGKHAKRKLAVFLDEAGFQRSPKPTGDPSLPGVSRASVSRSSPRPSIFCWRVPRVSLTARCSWHAKARSRHWAPRETEDAVVRITSRLA